MKLFLRYFKLGEIFERWIHKGRIDQMWQPVSKTTPDDSWLLVVMSCVVSPFPPWKDWPVKPKGYKNKGVWLLRSDWCCGFCFLLDQSLKEKLTSILWDTHAAPRRRPHGKKLRLFICSCHQFASHVSKALWKPTDSCSPGQRLDHDLMRPRARTTQLSYLWIPEPQKPRDNKLFLLFQTIMIGIICYVMTGNKPR